MTADPVPRRSVWAARVCWLAVVLVVPLAVGDALDTRARAVQVVVQAGLWSAWTAVAVALLVPSTLSLTAARLLGPAAVPVTLVASATGAGTWAWVAALAVASVAAAVLLSAEVGEAFVQASAYGAERRFLLRAPASIAVVAVLAWLLGVTLLVSGPLLLASSRVPIGAVSTAIGVGWSVLVARGAHRLSRRWLVFVPAGLVVHDHVVLADTVMLRRSLVVAIGLAPPGSDAADLTGGALGPALEVTLHEHVTVALVGRPGRAPTPIHLRGFLVSASRPGRVLRHAATTGWA
jgi:hypothetical protein